MTMRDDLQTQANELMFELDAATTAMMGMVGSHHTTGPLWHAAAIRQSRSFGRWNSFIKRSDIYAQTMS